MRAIHNWGIIALLVLGGIVLYSQTRDAEVVQTDDAATDRPEELRQFKNDELGFSFSYPARYGSVKIETYDGEIAGKAFQGFFERCTEPGCMPLELRFGSSTADFQSPRESATVEKATVWFKENGRYYYGSPDKPERNVIPYEVKEIQAGNATGIILEGKQSEDVSPGELGPGVRQAFFKLNRPEFSAMTFVWNIEGASDQTVKSILRTLQVEA